MTNSERNQALLIRAYAHEPNHPKGISPLDRLVVLAACELVRKGLFERIVVTSGSLIEGQPPLSELIAAQVRKNLPRLDPEKIITTSNASGTISEEKEFARLAQENDWRTNGLSEIGLRPHIPRIQKVRNNVFGENAQEVKILCAEWILRRVNASRYHNTVSEVKNLPLYKGLEISEIFRNAVYSTPLIGKHFMERFETLPNKGLFQDVILKFFGRN